MVNLLQETLDVLREHKKTPKDVLWVGTRDAIGGWEDFYANADFDYDGGYGWQEVNLDLKIVGTGWWLERGEYDGSEWWAFKTQPIPPSTVRIIQQKDLRE